MGRHHPRLGEFPRSSQHPRGWPFGADCFLSHVQIKESGLTNSIMTFYELTEGGDLVHTTGEAPLRLRRSFPPINDKADFSAPPPQSSTNCPNRFFDARLMSWSRRVKLRCSRASARMAMVSSSFDWLLWASVKEEERIISMLSQCSRSSASTGAHRRAWRAGEVSPSPTLVTFATTSLCAAQMLRGTME